MRELLDAMCRVIVDEGGYRSASVRNARQDAQETLALEAHALPADTDPDPAAWAHGITVSWADTELGQNPGGIAFRTKRPGVCQNLLTPPTP
ncbi:hypothetical protein GPA27_06340 [Aromatoleum toluolicum]|uniref:Uncharacterized protein n=1 Tax=Aromatoleum toluolicum TaxID=90060 RepID=A0ABX1NCI1_9RHOO|nr:hypothetical protein [Aromatoleum toluolicum]NMF97003.1 hypothetical protein [Aromatoleum toluolicum]